MIDTDRRERNRVATFRPAGVGQAITQNCFFCNKPRHQLGGTIVKRAGMRLFKCALCLQAEREAAAKEITS